CAPPATASVPLSLHDALPISRQEELLGAYGYPYVMDEFRFHMTLTDRLEGEDCAEFRTAAQTWFAPVLGEPVMLDRLVLFVEPRSEEHTSELQSRENLVCRLL